MDKDNKLIANFKTNQDSKCLEELIERHSGIYVDMVNKYLPENYDQLQRQDVLEDKDFSIYNAVINFDESKNTKFSTYLGNIAKWKCLNIYNKNKKFPQHSINSENVSIDRIKHENFLINSDVEEIEKRENLSKVHKIVSKSKDPRVKKIFKMRYSSGNKVTPWKKIAKKLDLSIQGCINIHNKNLTEIKRYV